MSEKPALFTPLQDPRKEKVRGLLQQIFELGEEVQIQLEVSSSTSSSKISISKILHSLEVQAQMMQDDQIIVGVIGSVNVGKSTLVSALVGQRLAPATIVPLTMIPVKYTHQAPAEEGGSSSSSASSQLNLPAAGRLNDSLEAIREKITLLQGGVSTSEGVMKGSLQNIKALKSLRNNAMRAMAERLMNHKNLDFKEEYCGEHEVQEALKNVHLVLRMLAKLEAEQDGFGSQGNLYQLSVAGSAEANKRFISDWMNPQHKATQNVHHHQHHQSHRRHHRQHGGSLDPTQLPTVHTHFASLLHRQHETVAKKLKTKSTKISLLDLPGVNEDEAEEVVNDGIDLSHILIMAAEIKGLEGSDSARFHKILAETSHSRCPRILVATYADELMKLRNLELTKENFRLLFMSKKSSAMKADDVAKLPGRVFFVSGKRKTLGVDMKAFLEAHQRKPVVTADQILQGVKDDDREGELGSEWASMAIAGDLDEKADIFHEMKFQDVLVKSEKLIKTSGMEDLEQKVWELIAEHPNELLCTKAAERGAKVCRDLCKLLGDVIFRFRGERAMGQEAQLTEKLRAADILIRTETSQSLLAIQKEVASVGLAVGKGLRDGLAGRLLLQSEAVAEGKDLRGELERETLTLLEANMEKLNAGMRRIGDSLGPSLLNNELLLSLETLSEEIRNKMFPDTPSTVTEKLGVAVQVSTSAIGCPETLGEATLLQVEALWSNQQGKEGGDKLSPIQLIEERVKRILLDKCLVVRTHWMLKAVTRMTRIRETLAGFEEQKAEIDRVESLKGLRAKLLKLDTECMAEQPKFI